MNKLFSGRTLGVLMASCVAAAIAGPGCVEEYWECTTSEDCPGGYRCVIDSSGISTVSFCSRLTGTQEFIDAAAGGKSFEMKFPSDAGNSSRVTFGSSYFVGKYKVTVGDFRFCVNQKNLCNKPAGGGAGCVWTDKAGDSEAEKDAVNCVSWDQAVNYCAKMFGGRLCSESEWQFASSVSADREQFVSIGAGLHEWVRDEWHAQVDGLPSDGSAWESSGKDGNRVVRGGDNYRASLNSLSWATDIGFRCCVDDR